MDTMFNPFARPESRPAGIKARVVVKDMYDQGNNIWPNTFAVRPQRGDTVQADDGRRLTVLEVVHALENGEPMLQVEVGTDQSIGLMGD